MTCNVFGGTLNLTQLQLKLLRIEVTCFLVVFICMQNSLLCGSWVAVKRAVWLQQMLKVMPLCLYAHS